MAEIAARMREKLVEAFAPTELEVIDESHFHAGHRGAIEHARDVGTAESHFQIKLRSAAFSGLSRLARHQAVMEVLSEEIARIHAISLDLDVP